LSGMVITLKKSKFDSFSDVFDRLLSKLNVYDSTVQDLRNTVAGVGCEENNQVSSDLSDAIDAIVDSEESKEDKKKKINDLKDKLETFVNDAVQHERAAADKIREKKKDFYKNYSYLEPDCEKDFWNRAADFGKKIGRWVADHLDVITAALIVLAAIVIVVFFPGACAILAIIVGVLSAVMGIADIVFTVVFGTDVAGMLEYMGFETFAKFYKGLGWGLDIASVILPIGAMSAAGKAAFKASVKSTLKEAFTHPIRSIGNVLKGGWNSVKTAIGGARTAFGSGFKNGLKFLRDGALKWGGKLIGLDELKNGKALWEAYKSGQRGAALSETACKLIGLNNIPNLSDGPNMQRYDNMIDANRNELNAFMGNNSSLTTNGATFKGMDVNVPTGTGNSGDAFLNSVKGNENLSRQLLDSTGVDINNISNGDDLYDALRHNGFTLSTGASDAAGTANVTVVPSWAYRATDGGAETSRILTSNIPGVNHDFRSSVMGDYNRYMNTMNNMFQNSFGEKCAGDLFGKAPEFIFNEVILPNSGLSDREQLGIKSLEKLPIFN